MNTYSHYTDNPYTQYLPSYNQEHSSMMVDNHQRTSNESRESLSNHSSTLTETDKDDDEYCQICGDIASGWHCG